MVELIGTIEEVIYKNESNGYVVAMMETEDDFLTIVGYIPMIKEGETLKVVGKLERHINYGEQLKVESYSTVVPETESGIERYLGSGMIPGIGPKLAKLIVDRFKKDSLDIIQYNPEQLLEIEGIGEKKLKKISEAFNEQRHMRDVMVFLQGLGVSVNMASKIYRSYKDETIKKIKENPYKMADEISGIGFKQADRIAVKMGVPQDSKYRVQAAIKHILMENAANGNCYMKKQQMILEVKSLLAVPIDMIEDSMTGLMLKNELKAEKNEDGDCIYHIKIYNAELEVAKKILDLSLSEVEKINIEVEETIEKIESKMNSNLASKQREAVFEALENGMLIVTGGPGTGKTTTINTIIKVFEEADKKVLLAAPTGRAAKRMSEATGKEAKTIHRLLEYGHIEGENSDYMGFGIDEDRPLETNVLIVDEVSMVDISLMNSLMRAVEVGTRLILVGDVDQLPSVGPGNVLRDIIESDAVKVVKLDEIFRQAKESMIVVNAHKINKGEYPELNVKGKDFFFVQKSDGKSIAKTIVELCTKRLPSHYDVDELKDIQVLTPMKKGDTGVEELNKILQNSFNPAPKDYDEYFRVGDKVMQIKNNYKTKWKIIKYGKTFCEGEGVFNGDIGYVTKVDENSGELTVMFEEEKQIVYSRGQIDELTLAYATTIHKSQGSEFSIVVLPIFRGPSMLLNRNLLYTAVTRAKQIVVMVGELRYLKQMIDNNSINRRYSGLSSKLKKLKEVFEMRG